MAEGKALKNRRTNAVPSVGAKWDSFFVGSGGSNYEQRYI